jgi:hypothetical protein
LSSFWLILKQQWTIKISSPLFSIFSLVAILVGSRDQRTQFWKGAIQVPFHQSLVAIGPVVSEEKIKMWNVDGWTTDDGRQTTDNNYDNSSPGLKARWANTTKTACHVPTHFKLGSFDSVAALVDNLLTL